MISNESDIEKEIADLDIEKLLDESVDPNYKSNLSSGWQSAKKVQLHYFWGACGSGKSSAMEESAEIYYKEGMNIWHLWGARSLENLFWCVSKGCKSKWSQALVDLERLIEKNQNNKDIQDSLIKKYDLLQNSLHCNYNKAYPVTWIVPQYLDIDKKSVDRFNEVYFTSVQHFKEVAAKHPKEFYQKFGYEQLILKPII